MEKNDYEPSGLLDLDATYEAISQPAAEASGYRCIRANEILRSGVIDVQMYEMLLRAGLVAAGISIGNMNAVYEFGVRHALRHDRMTAKKIRTTIVEALLPVVDSAELAERSDQVWVYATLANCLFALGQNVDAKKYETSFFNLKPADWQQETYQTEKGKVLKVHSPER